MKLVFGVWNVPYGTDLADTGKIANILEDKYHIMGTFLDRNKKMVAKEVMEELLGRLQRPRSGGEMSLDAISTALKQSISNRDYNGLPGVPTRASLMGLSTRFKSGKRRGKSKITGVPRPSFIDSGLYQSSIRVVLKDD